MSYNWSRISTVAAFPFLSESDAKAVERLNGEIDDLIERRARAGAVADPIFQRYAADQAQDRGPAFKAVLSVLQIEEGIRQKLVGYYAACDAARQTAIAAVEEELRNLETKEARRLHWPEDSELAVSVKLGIPNWRRVSNQLGALRCGESNEESIRNEQELSGVTAAIATLQAQIASEPRRIEKVQADRTALAAAVREPAPSLSERMAAGVRRSVAAFRGENA